MSVIQLPAKRPAIVDAQKQHEVIRKAAQEMMGYAGALLVSPSLLTPETCDALHECLGRIEACGQVLNGAPETNEMEREHERADERDARRER